MIHKLITGMGKQENVWYEVDGNCMAKQCFLLSPLVGGCRQHSCAGLVRMWPLAAQSTAQALPHLFEHRWCITLKPPGWGEQWLGGVSSSLRGLQDWYSPSLLSKHWHISSSFLVEGETRPACDLQVFLETSWAQEPQAVICDYSSCFALHTAEATNLSWDHSAELLLPP